MCRVLMAKEDRTTQGAQGTALPKRRGKDTGRGTKEAGGLCCLAKDLSLSLEHKTIKRC